MRPFDYHRPDTAEAALNDASDGTAFIGGGTNLLDLMKLEVMTPDRLVDVNHLGLNRIEETDDGIEIGATVRNSDLADDARIRRRWPVLSRALLAGASPQLRNTATTAGNLLQRTRCPYFQDIDAACNKRDPGSGCAAVGGELRNHAVLGTSEHCIALHPSDMAVAMRALDAEVVIRGSGGSTRTTGLPDFYRLPGETPHIETTLEPGELITAIRLPAPPGDRQAYRKVRERASYAFALVSTAAVLRMENGKIASAALAFGGVGTQPWRDAEVDTLLRDERPSNALFDKAGEVLMRNAELREGLEFKKPLAQRVLKAVLTEVTR
ncbi:MULTISPECIES: FAD binding domain-containing protein [unclassified Roseovarius]|uniref:FAD binding domain-containing protein n=1 Tax=unclassified Roseovarius TaxID=2614913 RepID=UPI00273D038A|nr:xanthine dehydrogenase family protein subunit M [Roseovarius sp. MMSF_3350]